MEDIERAFIIIDGNNFYHRLKELNLTSLLSLDYEKFAQFLIGRRELVSKNYYIGAILSHKPSYGLITHSNIRRLLTKEDIQQFLV